MDAVAHFIFLLLLMNLASLGVDIPHDVNLLGGEPVVIQFQILFPFLR